MTSQKFICEITSLVVILRKTKMKNASMPIFSVLPSISDEILLRFCSDDLIQSHIKIGLVRYVKNQAIFTRICMESLEHNCGNNSLTICTNILIFSKDTYLVLISRMISTNPISSQILIFVTSHFATLYMCTCQTCTSLFLIETCHFSFALQFCPLYFIPCDL